MDGARMQLSVGRVTYALPYLNNYTVIISGDHEVQAIALNVGSGRRGGQKGGQAYMPGSWVLVAEYDTASSSDIVAGGDIPATIVAGIDIFPSQVVDEEETDIYPGVHDKNSPVDFNTNSVYRELIKASSLPVMNQDRGFNRDLAQVPGQFSMRSALGVGVSYGDFLSRLSGSPAAFIQLYNVHDLMEARYRASTLDMGYLRSERSQRGKESMLVDCFSWNANEGLGAPFNMPAFVEDPSTDDPYDVTPVSEEQLGFFRRMMLSGGAVEGSWDTLRTDIPSAADSRTVFTNGEVFPGMLSEMKRMDGVYRLRAAQEIKFERTAIISVPCEKKTGFLEPRSAQDADEPATVEEHFSLTEDELEAVRPLMHDILAEYEEQNLYFGGLRKDGDIWVLPTLAQAEEAMFGAVNEFKLPVLDPDATSYTLDDLAAYAKEVEVYPGCRKKLFKNSSAFIMSAEGGFVLADGWGGEIRMQRGNVTISAAGDLTYISGRDSHEMVGRNKLSRTKQRVEFVSTNNSFVAKAETNMHLLGGNGGAGGTIIENKSKDTSFKDITADSIDAGSAYGAGVIITSEHAGVSVRGSRLYAGPYANTKNGVSATGMDRERLSCDIHLDSGSGVLSLAGKNISALADDSVTISIQNSVTGLYMTQYSNVLMSSTEIGLLSREIFMDYAGGSMDIPRLLSEGLDKRSRALPSRAPDVSIQGRLLVRGNVETGGSVYAEESVAAKDGCSTASADSTVAIPVSRADQFRDALVNVHAPLKTSLEGFVSNGAMTEKGQKSTTVAFPDSDAYHMVNYTMVAPRWQRIVETTAKWEEKPVENAIVGTTYPFFGKSTYDLDDTLVSVDDDGRKTTAAIRTYTTNTRD